MRANQLGNQELQYSTSSESLTASASWVSTTLAGLSSLFAALDSASSKHIYAANLR
jgi:hypothetical protein